jgi:hypothetical protein
MTDLLKKAIAALEKLPTNQQDVIAKQILEELEDERQWDETFADPRSEIVLDTLIACAKQQVARGEATDLDAIL